MLISFEITKIQNYIVEPVLNFTFPKKILEDRVKGFR